MSDSVKKEQEKGESRNLGEVNIFICKSFLFHDIIHFHIYLLQHVTSTDNNLSDGIDGTSNSNIKIGEGKITAGPENAEEKLKAKSQVSMIDLDRMVADSLKDIDVYEDDGDDNDPDLLNELKEIIEPEERHQVATAIEASADIILPTTNLVPELLRTRIEMYKIAEANANSANDSSRSRRLGRGLTTLDTMLKDALAGKAINMDDIPPEVITKMLDSPSKPPDSMSNGEIENGTG